jgi:hypothetical protein
MNWADRQELWDLMVKKESGMYIRQKAEHMLARHPALQPQMRAMLLGKFFFSLLIPFTRIFCKKVLNPNF